MASYSFHKEFGKCLTAIRGGKEGDTVTISVGSYAYTLPQSRFGWQGSEFTSYVLPTPLGYDEFGAALFDLEGLGQCPLDGSFQNEVTRNAAQKRWLNEVLNK
jgi:hypothetical protein